MSWEQHRYAVERARDMRRKTADAINDHCAECGTKMDMENMERLVCKCPDGPVFAGVTLQGDADGSDAEMLDDVADFLRSLDGSKPGMDCREQFIADWDATICAVSNFCAKYDLPKPDMIFHPSWQSHMSLIAGTNIGSPLIYAGVRVRFGTLSSMDVLRT